MAKMAILRRAAKLVIGPATSGRTRWRPPQDDVSQESHMITERQKAFRQEYRSRIVGWYDGYIHILIHLRDGQRGVLCLRRAHSRRHLAGMADRAADVLVHQRLRVGGAPIHHASSGEHQRAAGDL